MRYSTIKNIFELCKDDEAKGDFGTNSTKELVLHFINSVVVLQSYITNINIDISESRRFEDFELQAELLRERNDIETRIAMLMGGAK